MKQKHLVVLAVIAILLVLMLEGCTAAVETGFKIDTSEMRLKFDQGANADFTKLKVYAVFDDDTTKAIRAGADGYTLDKGDFNKDVAGEYVVKVKYKNYPVQTFTIKVKSTETPPAETPTVSGIVIKEEPAKKIYELNEPLVLAGLEVKKNMSDGTEVALTGEEYEVDTTAYNNREAGDYTIVVKLKTDATKTASFTVTVKAAPAPTVSYRIKTLPRTAFLVGESFDASGLEVERAEGDTAATLERNQYEIDFSAFDSSKAGSSEIEIIVKSESAGAPKNAAGAVSPSNAVRYTVSVSAIMIDTGSLKTRYREGDALDTSGLKLALVDADGKKTPLTEDEYEVDQESFFPWLTNYGSFDNRIRINIKRFPKAAVSYAYTVDPAPLATAEIDWGRTSSILPYGYAFDAQSGEYASIFWKGTDIFGRETAGGYQYFSLYDAFCELTGDPVDTGRAGVYRVTLNVRVSTEDEAIALDPIDVTVLAEGESYANEVRLNESEIVLNGNEAIDLSEITVVITDEDRAERQATLNADDWLIDESRTGLQFELKFAYRTRANEKRLGAWISIRREYGAEDTPNLIGFNFQSDFAEMQEYGKTGENAYVATLKKAGILYRIEALFDHRPEKTSFEIIRINGVDYVIDPESKDPQNSFVWDGATTVIEYESVSYDWDEVAGQSVRTVLAAGTLTILPDAAFVDPEQIVEVYADGVKVPIRYEMRGEGFPYGRAIVTLKKTDTALPIRFSMLADGYALRYRNDSVLVPASGFETVFYYESARENEMLISFMIVNRENGATVCDATITFVMESKIVSIVYDQNPDGTQMTPEGHYYIDCGNTIPSLQKLNISLSNGYRYRLYDDCGNEIESDAQLKYVLKANGRVRLKVFEEDGTLHEIHDVEFWYQEGDTVDYAEYFMEADENSERVYPGGLQIEAEGMRFYRNEYYTADQILTQQWFVSDGSGQRIEPTGNAEILDRNGNVVDLRTFSVLGETMYLRLKYTIYGAVRNWDEENQTEYYTFTRIERSVVASFRFASVEEAPDVYAETFGLELLPEGLMMDLSKYETTIQVFRTTEVTKEDFKIRFREEYRDTMRMTVEDVSKDRYLVKLFEGENFRSFFRVFVVRAGVLNDDTSAVFTYKSLLSDEENFVYFTGNEVYITAEQGAFLNVKPANEFAEVRYTESVSGAVTLFDAGQLNQFLFSVSENFTLAVTVTSTDESRRETYMLYVSVKEESPLWTLEVAGRAYSAYLSEVAANKPGDFIMEQDFGYLSLTTPLSASELGASYSAEQMTLTLSLTSDGQFYQPDMSTGGVGEPIDPGEQTLPLMTIDDEISSQYAGMYGIALMLVSSAGNQQIPILIVVNPLA